MNAKLKIWTMIGLGSVGFIVWSALAWLDPSMRADYLTFVKTVVVGVVGLALREMQTSADQSPKDPPQ
jgi:hypothetical protein